VAAFKIGINMAGAISAGAYTAGVLDFLAEALDEWYKAKARGETVPEHDVSIEVISGASAGGMCGAISAVLLHESFDHIRDTTKADTNNRLYESWVNRIDISELLKTSDLNSGAPVTSLLDSTVIADIARYALTPGTAVTNPPPYVSPGLTLFLSLTNLRGTPYSLNGAAPGSIEETTFFFGDRIRFQTVSSATAQQPNNRWHILDFSKAGMSGGWDILQSAAIATGAFPVFLAPRVLNRRPSEYTPPMWESVTSAATGTPPPISPTFPPDTPDLIETLNIDGGVTNNDPFNYAHDFLAELPPALEDGAIPSTAGNADRAVISIAPFPTSDIFDAGYQPAAHSSVFSVLGKFLTVLLSQSRFFGESLQQVMTGTTFSRFVIAPSDAALAKRYHGKSTQPPALQCGTLGAFGGFFNRGFRAHDYVLGRRNCQKFLSDSFILPKRNVVIAAGLERIGPTTAQAVIDKFRRGAPGNYAKTEQLGPSQVAADDVWLPIIPLCTDSLRQPIPRVVRAKMTEQDLDVILDLIMKRFKALMPHLISAIPSMPFRTFLSIGQPAIRFLARKPLHDLIAKQLGDSYESSR
jgi:hypothetical protein